jgi:ABC-type phosphate transport system substrate-binding protein
MNMKRYILLAALTAALVAPLRAAEVQVIANPGVAVAELSAGELKDIFLGNKTAVGGSAVEPVLHSGGATHEAFLQAYIGKSDSALRNYFKTLVFTGKGSQPKTFATDAEVLKYVMSTKGAIGYVSASADTGSARKIQVK